MRKTDPLRVGCGCAAGGRASLVRAAEHATLRNGFAMECNHHALVDGRVRLYLSTGEDSYIEMRPEEVTAFEEVPGYAAGNNADRARCDYRDEAEPGRFARDAGRSRPGTQS